MKYLSFLKPLIAMSIFCISTQSYGSILECGWVDTQNPDQKNETIVVVEQVKATCESDGEKYTMTMRGLSFGLRASEENIIVMCSDLGDPTGSYVGPKVTVSAGIDFTFGVFFGWGACMVLGGGIGIAPGSVGVPVLTIE